MKIVYYLWNKSYKKELIRGYETMKHLTWAGIKVGQKRLHFKR